MPLVAKTYRFQWSAENESCFFLQLVSDRTERPTSPFNPPKKPLPRQAARSRGFVIVRRLGSTVFANYSPTAGFLRRLCRQRVKCLYTAFPFYCRQSLRRTAFANAENLCTSTVKKIYNSICALWQLQVFQTLCSNGFYLGVVRRRHGKGTKLSCREQVQKVGEMVF